MTDKPLVVMVHGAWHWGGCFVKVANLLAARGFPVVTPDLASHGYDTTALTAIKSMQDYVAPAERIVAASERPIVLLGHSLGGATITYLAERYAERVRKLIYLTAVMPPAGKSVMDYATAPTAEISAVLDSSNDKISLRVKRDAEGLKAAFFADCSDEDVRMAAGSIITANSLVPMLWRSDVTPQNFGRLPRVYIETTNDRSFTLETQRAYQAALPGAQVFSMSGSHSPFFAQPEALAQILAAECESVSSPPANG